MENHPIQGVIYSHLRAPNHPLFSRAFPYLILLFLLSACSGESPTRSIELAKQGLYSATLSPTAPRALIASLNHGASFWDINKNERLFNWNHTKDSYTAIATTSLSANGQVALTSDQRRFVLWNTQDGKPIGFWNTEENITSSALSPKGNFALIGLENYTSTFLDMEKNRLIHSLPHEGPIRSVALGITKRAKNGKKRFFIGLTSADDMTAKVWDLSRGTLLHGWTYNNVVNHVDISSNGKWFFIANQHERWEIRSTKNFKSTHPYLSVNNRSMAITASQFSSDGRWLLIGGSTRVVELWDLKRKKRAEKWIAPKKNRWSPYSGSIVAVAFNRDLAKIYAITSLGVVHSWTMPKP